MSQSGRPRTLDADKQAAVCKLVASGVTVHKAARFVGCSRATIHNEVERNPDFRHQLERSKSRAHLQPLRTMRKAARDNWRAAAWYLERLDPEKFANPASHVLGKREAGKFVADLIAIIEQSVASHTERRRLHDLLPTAMPPAMRDIWLRAQSRQQLKQEMAELERQRKAAANDPLAPYCGSIEEDSGEFLQQLLREFNTQTERIAAKSHEKSQKV